jgi:hypothetical protein
MLSTNKGLVDIFTVRKKGKLLETIRESTDPDIIIGTETWLDPTFRSSEIFPDYYLYDIERRDLPNKGLVDIFTDECLLSPLHGTVYNIVEELFGLRHDGQVHVSSLFPNLLNSVVDIPIHCLCVHLSQSSQAMESTSTSKA